MAKGDIIDSFKRSNLENYAIIHSDPLFDIHQKTAFSRYQSILIDPAFGLKSPPNSFPFLDIVT